MPVFGGLNVHYGRAPWVNVLYYSDGEIGLPDDVAALYVPAIDGDPAGVSLVNTGSVSQTIGVLPVDMCRPARPILTEPAPPNVIDVTVRPGGEERVLF